MIRKHSLLIFFTVGLSSVNADERKQSIDALFSPHGGCTEAIVQELNNAKKSIYIQAYSFTSTPIAKALIDAHRRGVTVEAILDKSNRTDRYSSATFLSNQGARVWIDGDHGIAHNKVMLIDDVTIITGSFNFSKAAEDSNAENLLIIKNYPDLSKKYLENWNAHRQHAESYEGVPTSQPGTPETRTPQSEKIEKGLVYVTGSGKRYHLKTCRYLKGNVQEKSISEAKAEGKTPCKVCHPPTE